MNDPVAYFITWTTYGTWLPGDERGWVKRGEWKAQQADRDLEQRARALMTDHVVILTPEQRTIVDSVIVDHCRIRGWQLHARNVRTNHVHVVVSALVDPKIIREQLKAWTSRRLSDNAGLQKKGKDGRRRWWTEKGDIECIGNEVRLAEVILYVNEMQ